METVTLSSKYQVAIPKSIRDQMGIKVGQQFRIINYINRIEIIPIKEIKELRGFLKGIDTTVERERDRV